MALNNTQLAALREALINAFPDQNDLRMMVFDQLNERLNRIVSGGRYEVVVFDLLEWAEEQNRLEELLVGASRANPSNLILRNFFENNIKNLLDFEDSPIELDVCHQLIPIFKQLNDFEKLASISFQALPQFAFDNASKDFEDVKNFNLAPIVKIFVLLKLFIKDYPKQGNIPSLLKLSWSLYEEIKDLEIRRQLQNWTQVIEKNLGINLPSKKSNRLIRQKDKLEAYLIITIRPKGEPGKFYLNGYLEISDGELSPLDLESDATEKGVVISLKKLPERQAPKEIIELIRKSEKIIRGKLREQGYRRYNLTLEIFLPCNFMHEEIDRLKIPQFEEDWQPISEVYKLVVRSYERITEPNLWNNLQETWLKIKEQLINYDEFNAHIAHLETLNCANWQGLASQFRGKAALKLACSLPTSQREKQNLFQGIVASGVPIAIWTRCHELPGISLSEAFNNLLTVEAFTDLDGLLEEIRNKRLEVNEHENPEQHLGYHLGILYESDRWGAVPLLEAIPLTE